MAFYFHILWIQHCIKYKSVDYYFNVWILKQKSRCCCWKHLKFSLSHYFEKMSRNSACNSYVISCAAFEMINFFASAYTQLKNGHWLKASRSVACWLHMFLPSLAVGYGKLRVFYVSCKARVILQLRIPKNIKDLTFKELVLQSEDHASWYYSITYIIYYI